METIHLIEETEAKEILAHNIAGLEIEKASDCALCKVMSSFSDYTIKLIKQGNLPLIRDCFNTAGELFETGSKEVKLAVENVFVFSVTAFMDLTNAVSKQVKELFPQCLMAEYQRQVEAING